jgi:exodeoxyribonuclease VII small subunit
VPTKKLPANYESAIERLEEITQALESGEASLEESIDLYTEGLTIAKFCQKTLAGAEKKIKLIAQKSGITVEEDFNGGETVT